MSGKQDRQTQPESVRRPPLVQADRPTTRRFDSQTGRPIAPGAVVDDEAMSLAPSPKTRPFRRSTLARDLILVVLHLTVYVVVIGGILYQLQFIGAGPVTFRYSSFDAIFWPGWVWGTLIAAQAGAAVLQRRRFLGAILGAMASVLLGSWLLSYVSEYVVAAIVFRSIAVALAALAIAISLLRRAPAILTTEASLTSARAEPGPVMVGTRRSSLISIPNLILGVFALVFVLAAIAHGTYRALEVRGSGVPTERQFNVAPFSRIVVGGTGSLVVRAGAAPAVTVSVDDNLLDALQVTSAGGELSLWFDPGGRGPARLSTPPTYIVTVPTLESLSLGDDVSVTLDASFPVESLRVVARDNTHVRFDGMAAESLSVALRGDASMTLAGRTGVLVVDAGDRTVVDARELASGNVTATVWDSSTVRLGEASTLEYRQSGRAAILCDRVPVINPDSEAVIPQCPDPRVRRTG